MRGNAAILAGLGTALATVVTVVSCQTYDFDPVPPLAVAQKSDTKSIVAKRPKPNLMIVLDKSGSMNRPIDANDPNCPLDCGNGVNPACPSNCPTRITDLRSAMSGFLTDAGTVVRLGLVEFPTNAGCGAPVEGDIKVQIPSGEDDASLQAAADAINAEIQSLSPIGGTPTGLALGNMQAYAPLQDGTRDNFFLLLTDGEPNCNASNPNTCADVAACQCTLAACTTGQGTCQIGCLDKDGTVATIQSLETGRNIGTFVVGFGSETGSGNAPVTLSEMAVAGGWRRKCPLGTDAECGAGDTCDIPNKNCNRSYYQATNGAELATTLAAIGKLINVPDPCHYDLTEAPSDPRLLSVVVNDIVQDSSTWSYDSATNSVTLLGALCAQAKNATQLERFDIEIRIPHHPVGVGG